MILKFSKYDKTIFNEFYLFYFLYLFFYNYSFFPI